MAGDSWPVPIGTIVAQEIATLQARLAEVTEERDAERIGRWSEYNLRVTAERRLECAIWRWCMDFDDEIVEERIASLQPLDTTYWDAESKAGLSLIRRLLAEAQEEGDD